MSLHVVVAESQEIFRRDVKEHVIGVAKPGEKMQKSDVLDLSSGCRVSIWDATLMFLDYVTR